MEYREELERAYLKTCDDYDKGVLALSGGALGISMAFIRSIVRDQPIHSVGMLLSAWISWGASLLFVIASFYFSRRAIQHEIDRIAEDRELKGRPGGALSRVTEGCAILGGIAFLLGVCFMISFASSNLGGDTVKKTPLRKLEVPPGEGQKSYVPQRPAPKPPIPKTPSPAKQPDAK